ncbi:hypothetical protein [Actinoplanes sp. NPDC051494]|uniref:hypothetical protein n=1 Tax=Actinoplanes sp. NPDC051494 TaxID=3363907 RepID=UPI0037B6AE1B
MSLIIVLVSACGSPTVTDGVSAPVPPSESVQSTQPSTAPPSESAPAAPPAATPPTQRPGRPPKTPTDNIESPGWTEGYVVRGGTGPCYGLLDSDGFPYAMYSDAGTKLEKGDHVRVRVVPAKLRIYCGEGTPVTMEAVEHVS